MDLCRLNRTRFLVQFIQYLFDGGGCNRDESPVGLGICRRKLHLRFTNHLTSFPPYRHDIITWSRLAPVFGRDISYMGYPLLYER